MIADEPTLSEMLAEPIVRLVMAADRVDEAALVALVGRIAEARQASPGGSSAVPARSSDEGCGAIVAPGG